MQVGDLLALHRGQLGAAGQRNQVGQGRAIPPEGSKTRREVGPLVHQRRDGHRPAASHLADDVVVRHLGAVEEDLVEGRAAVHLPDGADLQPPLSLLHREGEAGDALLALRFGVGPGQQNAVVGLPGVAGPDLLAVHPPGAGRAFGTGSKSRQVAAGVRLAEELAPDLRAVQDRRQEAALLLLAAVGDDGRPRPAGPDHRDRAGRARLGQLLADQVALERTGSTPAVFDRPGRRAPATFGEPALPLPAGHGAVLGGVHEVSRQPLADLLA